jgi:quinol-cytochrome oxidoreductase complex cytochrome b subunit
MQNPQKDVIKTRLLFGIGGSFLFIFLGAWLFYKSENQNILDPDILEIVGILAIVFFAVTAIIGIKKYFSENP